MIYSFLGLQDISRINGVHPNCKIVRKWGKSYTNCEGIDITREYSIPPLRGMGESTSIFQCQSNFTSLQYEELET